MPPACGHPVVEPVTTARATRRGPGKVATRMPCKLNRRCRLHHMHDLSACRTSGSAPVGGERFDHTVVDDKGLGGGTARWPSQRRPSWRCQRTCLVLPKSAAPWKSTPKAPTTPGRTDRPSIRNREQQPRPDRRRRLGGIRRAPRSADMAVASVPPPESGSPGAISRQLRTGPRTGASRPSPPDGDVHRRARTDRRRRAPPAGERSPASLPCRARGGGQRAGPAQPVAHRPSHRTAGPATVEQFARMWQSPWLPEFVEIYIRHDLHIGLTRQP